MRSVYRKAMGQDNLDPQQKLYLELEGVDRSLYELLKKRMQLVAEMASLPSDQPLSVTGVQLRDADRKESFQVASVERLAHLTAALLGLTKSRSRDEPLSFRAPTSETPKVVVIGGAGPTTQQFQRLFSELGFCASVLDSGTDRRTEAKSIQDQAVAVIALPFEVAEQTLGQIEERVRTHPLPMDEQAEQLEQQTGTTSGSSTLPTLKHFPAAAERGPLHPGDLLADGRFCVQRILGQGGMGIVYAVHDRARGADVALKTLLRAEPGAIYRLKREFRALADLTHPNLVRLHELFVMQHECFFTMELLNGVDFHAYVTRRAWQRRRARAVAVDWLASGSEPTDEQDAENSPTVMLPDRAKDSHIDNVKHVASALFDEQRLRSALVQLVTGVHALHTAGKLHRDLKPSNVLVDDDGLVTILDLGLAFDRQAQDLGYTREVIAGTPLYMAPELLEGGFATQASDWYAVGVMLYEAMTKRAPFSGNTLQMIVDKTRFEPSPLSCWVEGIATDLEQLTIALLKRLPEQRPTAADILRAVGASDSGTTASSAERSHQILLTGHEGHLRQLLEAFDRVKSLRKPVVALLTGPWGVGKTSLIERIAEQLDREATVLVGHCYERESVPHKAFDEVVDALVRVISQLGRHQTADIVPTDAAALVRLFPALAQIEEFSSVPESELGIPDALILRRYAYRALGDLLGKLSDKKPLFVALDDLQWGDADSARLLVELLGRPEPPPMLLVATYLSAETARAPCWEVFFSGPRPLRDMVEVVELPVHELSFGQAISLAHQLLRDAPESAREQLESICIESCGNLLLLRELCSHVCRESDKRFGGESGTTGVSLREVVRARLDRLSPQARALFELVCVSGAPLSQSIARLALDSEHDLTVAVAQLQNERLVKARYSKYPDAIDAYHDRIGAVGLSEIDPAALRNRHLALATAYERSGVTEPDALVRHYAGAGARQQAAHWAEKAAVAASAAFAFDRAAQLYRMALELYDRPQETDFDLRVQFAGALSEAGRGAEAAPIFMAAADEAAPAQALELRRRAAEQWLVSGHIAEGLTALSQVLSAAGLELPRTPRSALVDLYATRARLWLRLQRLGFNERSESQVPAADLLRIDACRAAWALSFVNPVLASAFQARFLLLALRSGEPYRIALGLGMEATYAAVEGKKRLGRMLELQRAQRSITARINHPHASAFEYVAEGQCCYLLGRWRRCTEALERAERLLIEGCRNVTWELNSSRFFWGNALVFRGRWRELAQRLENWLPDAEERGDIYALASLRMLRTRCTTLAEGATQKALDQIDEALSAWTSDDFGVQPFLGQLSRVQVHLYDGNGAKAVETIQRMWPAFTKSLMNRIQLCRIHANHHAGYALLSAAANCRGIKRKALLTRVRAHADALRREAMPWSVPFVLQMEAADAWLRSRPFPAIEKLHAAAAAFEATDMPLYAAACRYRLGEILGGEEGQQLCNHSQGLYLEQGIIYPARIVRLMAPGFETESA